MIETVICDREITACYDRIKIRLYISACSKGDKRDDSANFSEFAPHAGIMAFFPKERSSVTSEIRCVIFTGLFEQPL